MLDKSLESSIEDIGKRQKNLLPTCLLGTGAEFGSLLPYCKSICFTLLVKVFYQELYDDLSRSRDDLIVSTLKICSAFHLQSSISECEKIVDSLFWSGSRKYTFAFEELYFDDKTDKWQSYQFQYFEIDRDVSDLESGLQIYKLSPEAQEVVLKTHEILEEMDISIQQLVAELLIKKGNLKSALRMMDALDFRVRKLITSEYAHKEELIRNPKQAIIYNKTQWGNQLSEVKEQFKNELERYVQMNRILIKLDYIEEHRSLYLQLEKRIYKTRNLHDKLAKIVIENIRLEFQILNTEFSCMWMVLGSSFRKTIWEESILPYGFDSPDDMLKMVELVLSPKKPLLFPLEWCLSEHHLSTRDSVFADNDKKITNSELKPITLDWDRIIELWEPVFLKLLSTNHVSIEWLKNSDEDVFVSWIRNREALDFWVSFSSMEEPFIITKETLNDTIDDRIILIRKLIEKNQVFLKLLNKEISSYILKDDDLFIQGNINISKYNLYLKDVDYNDTK
ncbi:hypothetical protein [Clostridium sp. YIM B02500]|uniref:hypothetical protein n=1 Tax=Clostridium sp. YIM B02500 TaxID=2910681 RepID=UPI001EEF5B25|nr:hypothetical protein [Clostridium sp. YIM B02500]